MLFFVLAIVISVVYGGISIHKDHRTGVTSLTQRMVQFKDEPSILGIAVDENALYYSTGQQIVQILANGDANPLVNTVVDIAFIGYNLGRAMDEIIQILVHEKPCTNTNYVNASYVTCTVGLNTTSVSKNEIVFQTTRGKMKGQTLAYEILLAEKSAQPILVDIQLNVLPFQPQAIAVMNQVVYFSDIQSERIYYYSMLKENVHVLVDKARDVYGMTVFNGSLYYTSASQGTISKCDLQQCSPIVLVSYTGIPKGLCIDALRSKIYFTDKMATIYQAKLDGSNLLQHDPLAEPKYVQAMIKLDSIHRLNGIALDTDNRYAYWTESTTNTIARSSVDLWYREPVAGYHGDQKLSWPSSVALYSDTLYFSEYAGRIRTGSTSGDRIYSIFLDTVSTLGMQQVDAIGLLQDRQNISTMYFLNL